MAWRGKARFEPAGRSHRRCAEQAKVLPLQPALAARGERDAVAGRRCGGLVRAVNDLTELLNATRQIVAQTRQRVAGITSDGASRRVSLHDGDARPDHQGSAR